MRKKDKTLPAKADVKQLAGATEPPASLRPILSQRPLVYGEREADYDALFQTISSEIEPTTAIQWLHVKHLVDLTWEIHRNRRLKAAMINLARIEAVEALLTPVLSIGVDSLYTCNLQDQARQIAVDLERGQSREHKQAVKTLNAYGISLDDVTTQSMILSLPKVEKLDNLIASAEARVVLLLRDVDRLKDAFAARFRNTAEEIQEAEYKELEAPR